MPNPIDDPELFDAITLGGQRSPGTLTQITGHDRIVNWDVKTAKGQKGATTTLKDIPPAPFAVEIYLATLEDFAAWDAFKEVIDSTVAGPTPKALDIYHPDLAEQGITSVVKAGTVGTKHDGKGGQTKIVRFQEYAPPQPKTGTVSGSSTSSKREREENDPNAAANAELKRLTDEYQNTPWG